MSFRSRNNVDLEQFYFSNHQSDISWQEILVLLNELDQKQITQISLSAKPKQGILAVFQAVTSLLGLQFYSWGSMSKVISQNLVGRLSKIRKLLQDDDLPAIQIINARICLDKCGQENHEIIFLVKRIVSYCELFTQERQQISKQSMLKLDDLKQIDEDLQIKKLSLQQFLENAYNDDDQTSTRIPKFSQVKQNIPLNIKVKTSSSPLNEKKQKPKAWNIQSPNVSKNLEKVSPSLNSRPSPRPSPKPSPKPSPSKGPTPRASPKPIQIQSTTPRCIMRKCSDVENSINQSKTKSHLLRTTRQQYRSVSPISEQIFNQQQFLPQEEVSSKNKSSNDLRNQIEKGQKQIKTLKATENKLKWVVDREAKRTLIDRENKNEILNQKWKNEEYSRKIQIDRQKKDLDRSRLQETKTFKHMLSSPKMKSYNYMDHLKPKERINEGDILKEEQQRYKQQYQSLRSQLDTTLKQKHELQKDVDTTITVIQKKIHII